MSKKWYEKRTPEEIEAVRRFNEELRNAYYDDYALDGYAYAPKQYTQEEQQAKKEQEALKGFEKATGMNIPDHLKPKVVSDDPYAQYKAGGRWRGYEAYKPTTLDYRYIEQMANALASKHSVTVKVGDCWKIDLDERELTYNPMTLMTGSKAQMIASLLHEIGHLRHTTPVSKMQTNQKYGKSGHEILNLFEDFRIDEIMADSYSGAGSVYQANMPVIQRIADGFGTTEKKYRSDLVDFLQQYKSQLLVKHDPKHNTTYRLGNRWAYGSYADAKVRLKEAMKKEKELHKTAVALPKTTKDEQRVRRNSMSMATRHINALKRHMLELGQAFDAMYDELGLKGKERTNAVAVKRLNDAIKTAERGETLFGFECLVICEAYGVGAVGTIPSGLRERVDKCKPAIEEARNADSTQEVVDILNKGVYPHIDDLLLNLENGSDLAKSIGKGLAKKALDYAKNVMGSGDKVGETVARENKSAKNSGTGAVIPSEWANGEYPALKQSVQTAINDLVQRLRFMRASDTSNRYDTNLKRGKLHGKHLYRMATGDDRLFRRKTEHKDRIGQVGVSVIIDKSGSMYDGERMVHTVRGAIIIAETCKELNIPLEIQTFSGNNTTLKKHDEEYTKDVQARLAGLVTSGGGSSNLFMSLDKTEIKELKKRNKVAVILSDGGVGTGNFMTGKRYGTYMDEMRENHVSPVGIGIGCGEQITRLVGEGESTNDAYQLPAIFDRIMRGCVNKTLK